MQTVINSHTLPAIDTYRVPSLRPQEKMHDPLFELPPGTAPLQYVTIEHIPYVLGIQKGGYHIVQINTSSCSIV